MAACVSFMPLVSSIPLILQSQVSDPLLYDPAVGQRPGSLSSRQATVESQQPHSGTPVLKYRRLSGFYEHRRVNSSPDGISTLEPSAGSPLELSVRSGRTNSAPATCFTVPTMHENWDWTEKGRGKTIAPATVKLSQPVTMMELDEKELVVHNTKQKDRKSSAAVRNESSYGLFPSPRSSAIPATSPRPFTSSMLAPSIPSPALYPDLRDPSTLSPSPLPLACTLVEDATFKTPRRVNSDTSICPRSRPHSRSASISHSRAQSLTLNSFLTPSPISQSTPAATSLSSRSSSSKKVSFSRTDEIIQTDEEDQEECRTKLGQGSPRHQYSWNGSLRMNTPPVATKPEFKRQISIPSARGQTAGRSILRRTSSLEIAAPAQHEPSNTIDNEHVPVSHIQGIGREDGGNRSPPPPEPLPSLLEHEDDILDLYFEDVDLTSGSSVSTFTSELVSDPAMSSPRSSPSSVSTFCSEDDEVEVLPIAMMFSRNTRGEMEITSAPSCLTSGNIDIGLDAEFPARRCSMQDVDEWMRQSGGFGAATVK